MRTLPAFGPSTRIYVAGHRGLVGSAVMRALERAGVSDVHGYTHAELDLRDSEATLSALRSVEPDVVVLAAARVGGIAANSTRPHDFIADNLAVQASVFHAALTLRTPRLLFLGSSCIYPREAAQPIKETALMTGPLEPTNAPYAIAKIAGIAQVEAARRQFGLSWISAMPCNLFGPNDNYDPESSHVIPALLRRFEEARLKRVPQVEIWGTGRPLREFLHVDDLADACLRLLRDYDEPSHVNVGSSQEISIADLAAIVAETVGYRGELKFDPQMPDGTPRKVLDSTLMRSLGWEPRRTLSAGLQEMYDDYRRMRGRDPSSITSE